MAERMLSTDSPRLAVIAESEIVGSLVREVLATSLPGIETHTLDPAATTLALEGTSCVLIDGAVGGEGGVAVLRRIRAAGYSGAAVMLIAQPPSKEQTDRDEVGPAALGARCVARTDIARHLPDAVAAAIAAHGDHAGAYQVREAISRTQRLVAAGEIALGMQHSLNNPLGALLAELQLLAMEETLPPAHKAELDRIIDLCRKVISIVRTLDGVGGKGLVEG